MHANFKSPDLKFMASDGMPGQSSGSASRVSLSLGGRDAAEGQRVFEALAEGGTVTMPFAVTKKYGIPWMLNFESAPS